MAAVGRRVANETRWMKTRASQFHLLIMIPALSVANFETGSDLDIAVLPFAMVCRANLGLADVANAILPD